MLVFKHDTPKDGEQEPMLATSADGIRYRLTRTGDTYEMTKDDATMGIFDSMDDAIDAAAADDRQRNPDPEPEPEQASQD